MGNKLCPRLKRKPPPVSPPTIITPQQLCDTCELVTDHGTGETKIYKIIGRSIPSPYARPVLHVPGNPPPVRIHITVPEIIEIAKWGPLTDNLNDITYAKQNILTAVEPYTAATNLFIGTTAWHRNADPSVKEQADLYLQEMAFTTQDTGINTGVGCLSGEQEALYEATAVCFAARISGIPPPTIIVSSGGGSFQLSVKNPLTGWQSSSYNIGFREGIDILNTDGTNDVKLKALRDRTKLAITNINTFITTNLPSFTDIHPLRIVAISASFHAAAAASLQTGISAVTIDVCVNSLSKTTRDADTDIETYESVDDTSLQTVANSVIQHEIFSAIKQTCIDAYNITDPSSPGMRVHFCRDFVVDGIEFRCSWPMGKYLIDHELI